MPLKSIKNEIQSLEYYFHYILCVSKVDLDIKSLGVYPSTIKKYSDIIISDNYYRDYNCMNYGCCNNCCYRFFNIYTKDHFNRVKSIYSKEIYDKYVVEKEIIINKIPFKIIVEDHTSLPDEKLCMYLTENGCEIHTDNPIHCMFPLIKIKNNNGKLHIGKQPFGRRWNFPCPIGANEFIVVSKERFYGRCIRPFEILKENCEYFNIPNWCDEIIAKIHQGYNTSFDSTLEI